MAPPRQAEGPVTAGRLLDEDEPLDSTALELDPAGQAAALLREAAHPLAAAPGAGTWACLLEHPDEAADDRPRLIQWLSPEAAEPPPHRHPTTETFTGVHGELTLVVDGDPLTLAPGEQVRVDPGRTHTFRNETEDVVAFTARLPSMRSIRALYTVWKRQCELSLAAAGDGQDPAGAELGLLETLPLAEDLHDETTMTVAPVPVQRALWATVGRLARALGHDGIDPDATDPGVWERNVEQPPF